MCGGEIWQIPTREKNTILSTEIYVLRRSARISRMERIKNEHVKEITGVKGKLQIQRSRVRSPALPDFLSSSGSGTGSTQPREVN